MENHIDSVAERWVVARDRAAAEVLAKERISESYVMHGIHGDLVGNAGVGSGLVLPLIPVIANVEAGGIIAHDGTYV